MDPLSVLKDYFLRKDLESVTYDGDDLVFGDEVRFPRSVETAYKKPKGGYYTLEALFHYAKHAHSSVAQYTQHTAQNKVPIVTFLDRAGLLEYLEGRRSTNDRIDPIAMVIPTRAVPPPLGRRREEEDNDAARGDEAGPLSKKSRFDEESYSLRSEDTAFERAMERERPVRDREHLLLCHRKSFESILKKLNGSTADLRHSEQRSGGGSHHKEVPAKPSAVEALPPPPGGGAGRYAKVEEKQYWKGYLQSDAAQELEIDQYGGTGMQPQPQNQSSKLPSSGAPPRAPPRAHHQYKPHPGSKPSEQQGKQAHPIILVPNAIKTPLNTYNAKEFLEDGQYVFPDEKMKQLSSKPDLVLVQRKIGRQKEVPYVIVDKLPPNSPEWDRVVAVFVLGKEWQFKDWPIKTPAEILHKYKGVYIHFHNESVDALKTIKSWNVQILTLHRTQRHKDLQVAREFWESLDTFMNARKSSLIY